MPLLIGLGLGAGALNAYTQDQQYQSKKKIAAATQRYSPWTGMSAQTPVEPSTVGSFVQGGMQGAALGQGIQNNNMGQAMSAAQLAWLQNGYNPSAAGTTYAPGISQGGFNSSASGYNPYGSTSNAPSSYNSPWFGKIGS